MLLRVVVLPLAQKSQTWSCQSANQRSRPLASLRSKWLARRPQSTPIIIVECMTICQTHPNSSAPWTTRQTAARTSSSSLSRAASRRRNSRRALLSARTLVAEASTRSKSGPEQKEPTRILTTTALPSSRGASHQQQQRRAVTCSKCMIAKTRLRRKR